MEEQTRLEDFLDAAHKNTAAHWIIVVSTFFALGVSLVVSGLLWAKLGAIDSRVEALESGRNTPMAAETREAISSLRRDIEKQNTEILILRRKQESTK